MNSWVNQDLSRGLQIQSLSRPFLSSLWRIAFSVCCDAAPVTDVYSNLLN